MNGPLKMYRTKQVVKHDATVALPDCMYKLKNIHTAKDNGMVVNGSTDHVSSSTAKLNITEQNNQTSSGMDELQLRQDQILKQLAGLKLQMLAIKAELRSSGSTTEKESPKPATIQHGTKNHLPDTVVLNANPCNPPYALELIQKLLANDIGLTVTSYLHSTVSSLPDSAKALNERVTSIKAKANIPQIQIQLIWKNIQSNVELLLTHLPITGEVNLLRYFSRLSNNRLSYNGDFEVDSLLDVCYLISESKTKSARIKLLQVLTKSLSKSQFLAGRNKLGIADVAAVSAIKQVTSGGEVNATLTKWLQRCEVA